MHRFLQRTACVMFGAVLLQGPGVTHGQSIERIEEDWELHVLQPDAQLDAPQVTMTMLPFDSNVYLQIDWNHATYPEFSRGGFQVRACTDTTCLTSTRVQEGTVLSHAAEIVSWTQVVQRVEGGFLFGIENGTSTSFGNFGGPSTFVAISDSQSGAPSLNAYNPSDSAENSGVTFARNRVAWLRFKKARVFLSTGDVLEWTFNTDLD